MKFCRQPNQLFNFVLIVWVLKRKNHSINQSVLRKEICFNIHLFSRQLLVQRPNSYGNEYSLSNHYFSNDYISLGIDVDIIFYGKTCVCWFELWFEGSSRQCDSKPTLHHYSAGDHHLTFPDLDSIEKLFTQNANQIITIQLLMQTHESKAFGLLLIRYRNVNRPLMNALCLWNPIAV